MQPDSERRAPNAPILQHPSWAPRDCFFPIEDTQQLRAASRLTFTNTSGEADAAGAYCAVYFGNYTDAKGTSHSIAAKAIPVRYPPDYLRRDLDAANRIHGSQYVATYLAVTTRLVPDAGDEILPEYFIMLREGQTLEEWMKQGHWPMASQSAEERQANRAAFEKYLWCVLKGLNDLHDAGIVHRDAHPNNCIIATADTSMAKLIDLGIARSNFDRGALNAVALSGTNDLHKAPEYKSPDTATMSADVWAVGAMAAEWLFMEMHPTGGKSAWDAFASNRSKLGAKMRWVVGRVMESGDRLARLAMETLHDDPMQRPIASEAALILLPEPTTTFDRPAVDVVIRRIGASIHDLTKRYALIMENTPQLTIPKGHALSVAELHACCDTILNAVEGLTTDVNRTTRQALLRTVRQHLTTIDELCAHTTNATNPETNANSLELRARCHKLSGGRRNREAAIALYDRVIEIQTAAYGADHAEVARTLHNKANALQAMGGTANLTAVIALYDRVIEIQTAAYGADHAEVAMTLHNKANALEAIGGTANLTAVMRESSRACEK